MSIPRPSPDEHDRQGAYGARLKEDRKFSLASASLRQALQDMPEISEASKHIMLNGTKQGLSRPLNGTVSSRHSSRIPRPDAVI